MAVNGGKPTTPAPFLRPVTAADRIEKQQRDQTHERLLAQLLPRPEAEAT